MEQKKKLYYSDCFWLFLFGSIMGVIIEGVFTYFMTGHWESHVVSVWGWFNILYGAGAAGFYAGAVKLQDKPMRTRVFVMALIATSLELLCGLILKFILGMKAWDYSHNFLNIGGMVCLKFSLIWALFAFLVCLSMPKLTVFLAKLRTKKYKIASIVLSVVLAVNFAMTAVVLIRWSDRHYGYAVDSQIEQQIDSFANDEWMQNRFVEWKFLQ